MHEYITNMHRISVHWLDNITLMSCDRLRYVMFIMFASSAVDCGFYFTVESRQGL